MTKLIALTAAALMSVATVASAQQTTAPVAVTQGDMMGDLGGAGTWTAAGVVVVGALIVNEAIDDDSTSSTTAD